MSTYRTGNHQPRNLYRGDQYIGVMFDPIDAVAVVRHLNMGLGECTCDSYEPCRGECCGVGMCSCSATDEETARAEQGLGLDDAHTPDVDYARGAAEALALVAERIADTAEGFTPHALGTLGDILDGVAANLGVDEDAPPSPLSAPVTAQEPPTVGQDRPDAHSGSEARTEIVHLVREGSASTRCCYRVPFELPPTDRLTANSDAVTCGIVAREPEWKADQA